MATNTSKLLEELNNLFYEKDIDTLEFLSDTFNDEELNKHCDNLIQQYYMLY